MNIYISKCFHIFRTHRKNNIFSDLKGKGVVVPPQTLYVNKFEEMIAPIVAYLKKEPVSSP